MTDWLRCYAYALVALAWAMLLHLGAMSEDGTRVPFALLLGLTYAMHVHRAREKDQEQDAELARLRGDA